MNALVNYHWTASQHNFHSCLTWNKIIVLRTLISFIIIHQRCKSAAHIKMFLNHFFVVSSQEQLQLPPKNLYIQLSFNTQSWLPVFGTGQQWGMETINSLWMWGTLSICQLKILWALDYKATAKHPNRSACATSLTRKEIQENFRQNEMN